MSRAAGLGTQCHLYVIDVPLEVAIARAADRTDAHAHVLDAAAVQHLAELFEMPDESEGFELHVITSASRRQT